MAISSGRASLSLADFFSGVSLAPQYCRPCMTQPLLEGKVGVVFGVANKRSIAWKIAQACAAAGAHLIFKYQCEQLTADAEELTAAFGEKAQLFPCDVSSEAEINTFF